MRKTKEKFYTQQDFFKFYDQLIRETSLGKRTKKDGKRIRQNTIDNYIYCKKILLRFVTEKNFEIKLYLVNKLTKAAKEKAAVEEAWMHKRAKEALEAGTVDFGNAKVIEIQPASAQNPKEIYVVALKKSKRSIHYSNPAEAEA